METFTNYAVEQVRASGGSQQMIDAKLKEMKDLGVMLNNPLINAAFTFIEPSRRTASDTYLSCHSAEKAEAR